MIDDAIQHLIRVIGLCQTPRESWTVEDTRVLREAREFVQKNREGRDNSESKRSETSSAPPGDIAQQPDSVPAEGGVSGEGVPVKEGTEGTPNAED
jgi:hypothetical protein